ncbi:MtrAB system histidine kinase MtrB [Ruicaihuangia caeni]|uniref:Sensor histidine kinase MtrB n=1 Tax=Ruicaihuangia caeni TaxID=3042517 RepID=A0AAW6TDH4_9MICO|nr:MtrAB system histidine kinase MtrB [Klugiella sp. YN-L-19]MDI2099450.1 MtrAB system histidine kinase MtrB [Klugiella sp. YN-L-19]
MARSRPSGLRPWLEWRALRDRAVQWWRTSLQFRTVTVTVALSTAAVSVILGTMSLSIGVNLFESQRDQILLESSRAAAQVQQIFDGASASDQLTTSELDLLRNGAQAAIARTTSSASGTRFALERSPRQAGTLNNMQGVASTDLDIRIIGSTLRDAVAASDDALYYQSVALRTPESEVPGLVVGAPIDVPTAGRYELYLVYNLEGVQRTLTFAQQTLLVGGIALVAMIGAIAFVVARFVAGPIRLVAETSRKLAAGQLEERIPDRGEDDIATLARSFNAMADSMQWQITRLGELSRVQQRFVSDVSHELRTPLTTIRLAGDVLFDERESFSPTTARAAELMHAQVQRFELLLADLLEMSRFDAGVANLDTERTNIVRLVEDAVEAVRPLADSKGSAVRVVPLGGYVELDVDPRRIRRIMQNLLGNAIDHGEGRPIMVYVDSNQHAVAIAVRDFGIGMSEEQVARVFDRFWRADPSRQRTTGGTGLGLAIALEDAALHGGALDVWSEPEEGTCFRLTLPRRSDVEVALVESPLYLPPPTDSALDEVLEHALRQRAEEEQDQRRHIAQAPSRPAGEESE